VLVWLVLSAVFQSQTEISSMCKVTSVNISSMCKVTSVNISSMCKVTSVNISPLRMFFEARGQ
jgi:hypothetical protein